jgi:acyl-CoA thioester hydrolase
MLRFTLPDQKTLVHEMVIPVRWGDMDMMGHVNNTVYFRYFETSRIAWFDSIGVTLGPGTVGPVIVNAFCNFLIQVEYPADLRVRHYAANPGRSSFDTYVTMERTDRPGVVYAEGGAKVVWTDSRIQKSVPLPDELKSLIRGG